MKFTRDLCRLLGLGGDGPGEEELEAQDGASDPADGRKGQSSEVTVKNEEGLDEKERAKRRAERRRAKRKRQKERKKLEREERMEDALEQEEASGGAVTESNSEEEYKEEESWTAEPEWDVSSAFVANAASHIKLKGLKSRGLQITRENKENEARSSQGENTEEMKRRGESLTEQGIQMFGRGQYSQAVHMFSEAIYCDPKDHRFYGNRSYCYLCLEQYSSALKDAQRSIELAPDWPKGFFRKGCALMGLKVSTCCSSIDCEFKWTLTLGLISA
nr:PREDICTED: tetratricopeptide repeat protein 31-like isoform X3 [Paralichthys olivaceus]